MERPALTSAGARPLDRAPAGHAGASATLVDGIALLALALVPRLLFLDGAPLWTDELFSRFWSQLDPGFLLGPGARIETNPPGYYLLLHGWMEVAGASALAIRLPSVLFSAATVPVTYAIGRALLDRPTAVLAGLLAVVDPTGVLFAQEARPYALAALLDGVALLALARCARGTGTRGAAPWPAVALFVAAAVATVLAHYTSVFFVAACFAAIGLHLLTTRPFPRRDALVWVAAGLLVLLGIAEPLRLAVSMSHSANIAWIEPLTPWIVRIFVMELLTHPGISANAVMIAACAVLVLVLAAGLPRFRPGRAQFGVLVLIPALFCLLLAAVSVSRPLMLSRVGAWLTIPLCLLLAHAAAVQATRGRRVAAATASLLVLLFGLGHYFLFARKEDWPAAARLAAADPRCDGPVVFGDAYGLGLVFYEPSLADRPLYAVLGGGGPGTSEFALTERVMHPRVLAAAELPAFVRAHPRTVLVLRKQFLKAAPAPVLDLLARAPFREALPGDLTAACL